MPGDLTYTGEPDKLSAESLAEQAVYAAALVDRLKKAGVHYLLILDTCYEGTPSRFDSPVLTAVASQNISDIAKALRFMNEFHQEEPVLFSTTPGSTVPVAPDPTDPKNNSMGPLARRLVLLVDARVASKRQISVGDVVDWLGSPSADRDTRPAVTNAQPAKWWGTPLVTPGAKPGQLEERSGTATKPVLCCAAVSPAPATKELRVRGTISLIGSPSEFLTDGNTVTLRTSITIERPDPKTITLHAVDPDGDWEINFTSATPLAVQSYANATRAGFAENGQPGLAVTGHAHGCNEVRGSFDILSLPSGKNRKFAARFVHFCDDLSAPLKATVDVEIAP